MPARITKAQKQAFAAYAKAGGKATIRQYLALEAGRAKMLANRAARLSETVTEDTSAVAIVSKRKGRKAASAKPKNHTLDAPLTEVFRAPKGQRVDFMGGHLVVDEAGAQALVDALSEGNISCRIVGSQTSKRRGVRMQVEVEAKMVKPALVLAEDAGFRTWSAA